MERKHKVFKNTVLFTERLSKLAVFVSAYLIFVLLFAVIIDVAMRYLFNRPISWGIEIMEYMLVYIVFLGFAYTLLVDKHVNVDLVLNRLPNRVQVWLNLFGSLIGLLFIIVLAWKTGYETYNAYVLNWRADSLLTPPLALIYIVMPVGSLLFGLAFVCKIYHYIQQLLSPSEKTKGA